MFQHLPYLWKPFSNRVYLINDFLETSVPSFVGFSRPFVGIMLVKRVCAVFAIAPSTEIKLVCFRKTKSRERGCPSY